MWYGCEEAPKPPGTLKVYFSDVGLEVAVSLFLRHQNYVWPLVWSKTDVSHTVHCSAENT